MKKLITTIVVVLVVLLALGLAKDMIIKVSVEKGVAMVTGLRLSIQGLNVGIVKTLLGYPGKVFTRTELMDGAYTQDNIVSEVVKVTRSRRRSLRLGHLRATPGLTTCASLSSP